MEKKNKKQERRQQKEKNHFMDKVEKLGNHAHVLKNRFCKRKYPQLVPQ